MKRTNRSRIDRWLRAIVAAAARAPLVPGGWMRAIARGAQAVVPLFRGVPTPAFVAAISVPMRHMLRDCALHVRSGLLEWTLPCSGIRRATLPSLPLSSTAWSLRRVRIDCADGQVILVSPDERESFMEELARRCPQLVRNGPRLETPA